MTFLNPPTTEHSTMTDTEAMQQVEAGLRALFGNFIERSITTSPEQADAIKATAAEVLSGAHGLIFQVEVLPVAGIELNCGIAQDKDITRLARIFDGHAIGIIPQPGTGLCQ
jgi:hypothetical protein